VALGHGSEPEPIHPDPTWVFVPWSALGALLRKGISSAVPIHSRPVETPKQPRDRLSLRPAPGLLANPAPDRCWIGSLSLELGHFQTLVYFSLAYVSAIVNGIAIGVAPVVADLVAAFRPLNPSGAAGCG
jgi:hypothetical protein